MVTKTITNNSDNKVCIPKDITIGRPNVISTDIHNISEIILTVRGNDLKTYAQTNCGQKTHTINTHTIPEV